MKKPEKSGKEKAEGKKSKKDFFEKLNDIDFINRVIQSMDGFQPEPGYLGHFEEYPETE